MKLICLPYAGAQSPIFRNWLEGVELAELAPLELPGRGARHTEPLLDDFEDMLEDLFCRYRQLFLEPGYMMFGYSMGAILAFELIKRIYKAGGGGPEHVFLCACDSPDTILPTYGSLPFEEFCEKLRQMGGVPDEIFGNEKLLNFYLPIVHADFKAIDSYRYIDDHKKLGCAITLINGDSDAEIRRDNTLRWRNFTTEDCFFYEFDGSHFFIREHKSDVSSIINRRLKNK